MIVFTVVVIWIKSAELFFLEEHLLAGVMLYFTRKGWKSQEDEEMVAGHTYRNMFC